MSATTDSSAATRGALAATACYLFWGLVPLYWKQMAAVNAVELICHRCVWSLVFVLAVAAAQGSLGAIRAALSTGRGVATNLLSGALLTGNWLTFVWGVNNGHVVECSLGYFLVPLLNVALARLLLHEHLRRAQWAAIGCAAAGVVYLFVQQLGHPPWLTLTLASTWGAYGLMRKRSSLNSVTGLTVETLLIFPLAAGFLLWRHHTGEGALGHADARTQVLVLTTGVVTAIPLLLFAYAAKRVRFSTLGFLQYLQPSVAFVLGVWVYHEPLSHERAVSFVFIWTGLALYTADQMWSQRQKLFATAPAAAR